MISGMARSWESLRFLDHQREKFNEHKNIANGPVQYSSRPEG